MAKLKYIGNPKTREFHNSERLTAECQIGNPDDPKFPRFRVQKDAHDANFDACAKGCVHKYRSRR